MKLWLSKNSDVPMKEQLVTQIRLGIASEDLAHDEKLPSRQEIARRFKIHPNTVSNAYQELAESGLLEFRQGSGFYVKRANSGNPDGNVDLRALVTRFFNRANSLGFSDEEIKSALTARLNSETPKSFLVIESNRQLREILIDEIREATKARVYGISLEDFENEYSEIDANFVASFSEKPNVDEVLKKKKPCIYLKPNSVSEALRGESRPSKDSLIAVVSGWDGFLLMAKTFLVAAQVDSDSIIVRNTNEEGWNRGLESAWIIICDSYTARCLPARENVRKFRVISEDSIKELRATSLKASHHAGKE
ncbi:MAG: GntR family transcriptional regulator [Pyrinomonadaceae bacterium]|nr:GntR family transcriptional regulator [Pyrinomonadaceae bacterium]